MQHSVYRGFASPDAASRLFAPPSLPTSWLIAISVAATTLVSVSPTPQAKSPGASWCYRDTCHRVRTVEQTQALVGQTQVIETSFYDDPRFDRMNRGTLTSNGEVFDADNPGRAASSDYPDGTELLLRNPESGRTSHVRVNDFGPFYGSRLLDVTKRVAVDLGFQKKGVAKLEVTVLSAPAEQDSGYRRNRVLTPALGHVGVLGQQQATALIQRLLSEQPSTRLAVLAAAGTSGFMAPAVEVPPSPLQLDTTAAPVVEPEAVLTSSTAAPASVASAIADASQPIVLAALPVTVETPAAAESPRISPVAVQVASLVTENLTEDPIRSVTVVEAPPAQDPVAAPMVVAEAHTLPGPVIDAGADAAAGPDNGPANSPVGTPAEPRADPLSGLQQSALAWLPAPSALISQRGEPTMFLTSLVAGILSLLLASAWLLTRMWPRQPRYAGSSPLDDKFIGSVLADSGAPAAVALEEPAPTAMIYHRLASSVAPEPLALVAAASPVPGTVHGTAPGAGSHIGAGLTIEGALLSTGRIAIAGTVIGDIVAKVLEILPGGRVEGKISADQVSIGGTFVGTITASHLSVGPDADLTGEVVCQTVDAHITARMEVDFRRPRA